MPGMLWEEGEGEGRGEREGEGEGRVVDQRPGAIEWHNSTVSLCVVEDQCVGLCVWWRTNV